MLFASAASWAWIPIALTGAALQNSSDSCRMHFYQSFLAVLSARLTSANVRLVSF